MSATPNTESPKPTSEESVVLEQTAGDEQTAKPPPYEGYAADPDFNLRGGFVNPLVDAAMPLFGLAMRLRKLDAPEDIAALYHAVHKQVGNVVEEARQRGYEPAHHLAYSYALCLYLDETVLATAWGQSSIWSQKPLLSEYHHETWGGEKFFTLLSRMMMEPARYQQVLEFMYLCLCMGLRGKYGIQPKGDEALQAIIVKLQRMIRELRGPKPDMFCDTLNNVAPRDYRLSRQWPWWSPLLIAAIALASIYGIYAYRLHLITAEALQSLDGILRL